RRRHTRCYRDWSSDVCSSDLPQPPVVGVHVDKPYDPMNPLSIYTDVDTFVVLRFDFSIPTLQYAVGQVYLLDAMGNQIPVAGLEIGRASCRERVRGDVVARCS